MAKELVKGLYAKEADVDFVITRLSIKVEELNQFLSEKKNVIKENNGWIKMDILKSKSGKLYASYDDWKPQKQVTTADHSPDREDDGLPF